MEGVLPLVPVLLAEPATLGVARQGLYGDAGGDGGELSVDVGSGDEGVALLGPPGEALAGDGAASDALEAGFGEEALRFAVVLGSGPGSGSFGRVSWMGRLVWSGWAPGVVTAVTGLV